MIDFVKNKKIFLAVSALVFSIVILIIPHTGLAQGNANPIASYLGNGVLEAAKALSAPALLVIRVILSILQYILILVLGISGYFLDVAFTANITGTPADQPIIQEGWRISRDIANAFFILIVLWIAFTIIFNLEQYGGKRLLVRTIIIALLINFSLVFVSATFGFTNMLAKVFADNMRPANGDIAGAMVDAMGLHTATNIPSPEDVNAKTNQLSQGELSQPTETQKSGYLSKSQLFAAVGIPKADAQGGAIAGCVATIWFFGVGCVGGAIAGGIMEILGRFALGSFFSSQANAVLRLTSANIMLALGSFAFLIAAIALYIRMVAMIFLSVVAPLAFLAQIVPNKEINKYWSQWLDALMRWAFFAPMFYFLFYLVMFILDQIKASKIGQGATDSIDPTTLLTEVLVILLLAAAVKLARKTGGAVAETAISLGKTVGLTAAGGLAGMAASQALPRLGALGTRMDEKINERYKDNPVMRQLLAAPAAGFRQLGALGRDQIRKEEDKLKGKTSEELKSTLNQAGRFNPLTPATRAAIVRRLAQDQELTGLTPEAQKEVRKAIDTQRKTRGEYTSILKANPALARKEDFLDENSKESRDKFESARAEASEKLGRPVTNDDEVAQWMAWNRVKPQDIPKIDTSILKDQKQKEMFLAMAQGEHLSQLMRYNPQIGKEVARFLDDPTEEEKPRARAIISKMDSRKYGYFTSNAARELGWKITPEHDIPEAVLEEEEKAKIVDGARKKVEDAKEANKQIARAISDLEKLIRERDVLKKHLQELDAQLQTATGENRQSISKDREKTASRLRTINGEQIPSLYPGLQDIRGGEEKDNERRQKLKEAKEIRNPAGELVGGTEKILEDARKEFRRIKMQYGERRGDNF